MTEERHSLYAKIALCSARIRSAIHLFTGQVRAIQEMKSEEERDRTLSDMRGVLEDASKCLEDFQKLTGIDTSSAKGHISVALEAVVRRDVNTAYREVNLGLTKEWLGRLAELAK